MNKKVDFDLLGKGVTVSTDLDQDGVKSLELQLNLDEGYQEILKRGESVKIEGIKAVNIKMDGFKLVLDVDTDMDGENLLSLKADLPEVIDEGTSLAQD